MQPSKQALPVGNSMSICKIAAFSFRWIRGPMLVSVAWRQREPPAPRQSATVRCGKTSCHSLLFYLMDGLFGQPAERANLRPAMT